MSEEEQAEREALIAASQEKMEVDFGIRLNEVWGNLSTVTDDIDQTYSSFLEQLAADNPDLKDAFSDLVLIKTEHYL